MLHILLNPDALNRCARSVSEGDVVVFVGDGVYAATLVRPAESYVLDTAFRERGAEIPESAKVLPIAELPGLVAEHEGVPITWT